MDALVQTIATLDVGRCMNNEVWTEIFVRRLPQLLDHGERGRLLTALAKTRYCRTDATEVERRQLRLALLSQLKI